MSKRSVLFSAIVMAVFALMTLPSWARPNSNDTLSANIQLYSAATVNNTTLQPGQYKVIAEGSQAKFEKGGKVVAEVPCTLKTLSSKPPETEFVIDHDQLIEIHVSGKMQAIDFSPNQKGD